MLSGLATAGTVVAILILVACVCCLALRWLPAGAEARAPLPYVIALIPLLWAPILLCMLLFAVTRVWTGFAISSIVGIAWASTRLRMRWARTSHIQALLKQYAHNSAELAQSSSSPETSTVWNPIARAMTLNCRYGRASAQAIIQLLRDEHIQICALQEVQPELLDALQQAGLDALLPYSCAGVAAASDNGGCNVIFSAFPLDESDADSLELDAAAVPSVVLSIPYPTQIVAQSTHTARSYTVAQFSDAAQSSNVIRLRVVSAHPKSPMRGCKGWSAGIRALGTFGTFGILSTSCTSFGAQRFSTANPTRIPTVVMGDLNSHSDHPSFRALLRAGFADAVALDFQARSPKNLLVRALWLLLRAGTPLLTFPRWTSWPRIELDHILVSTNLFTPMPAYSTNALAQTPYALLATDARAHAIEGSDHLALTATLSICN